MAVVVANRTVGGIVVDVARLCGLVRTQGTSTAGTTTTLTDANSERTPTAQANDVLGTFLYMHSGDGAGQAREINAYGTIGVMGWNQTATSPGTNTGWVRLLADPRIVTDALTAVQRLYAFRFPQDYRTTALSTNNLLHHYGAMEEWTSGAPDGWAISGAGATVAQGTTAALRTEGLYSMALTAGAGATGVETYTIPAALLAQLDGRSLRLLGRIAETTAGDGVIRVAVTDSAGTTTNTDRTGTLASNRWERLEDISTATISLPDPVSALTIAVRAVASAVVYADDLWLGSGYKMLDYDLPDTLIGLQPIIWMEDDFGTERFTERLEYGKMWTLTPVDSTTSQYRRIHFHDSLPDARHLLIHGYRASSVVTTATSNVEMNPEALVLLAAKRALEGMRLTEETEKRMAMVQNEIDRMSRFEAQIMDGRRGKMVKWLESR